ncbi:Hypp9392 [Branchiostoma lanceolatum]|uniref:Hypp9392 protein n=1 Tax=Branchiostoma lanceolatum TaxID=7740 RepID=A0A8S4MML9_BRALA|nr:Hypp9392 [Branchiostoma lanceolatum]
MVLDLSKEVTRVTEEKKMVQKRLQEQTTEKEELQEANKSMAATIEELMDAKHTAKGGSQWEDYVKKGDSEKETDPGKAEDLGKGTDSGKGTGPGEEADQGKETDSGKEVDIGKEAMVNRISKEKEMFEGLIQRRPGPLPGTAIHRDSWSVPIHPLTGLPIDYPVSTVHGGAMIRGTPTSQPGSITRGTPLHYSEGVNILQVDTLLRSSPGRAEHLAKLESRREGSDIQGTPGRYDIPARQRNTPLKDRSRSPRVEAFLSRSTPTVIHEGTMRMGFDRKREAHRRAAMERKKTPAGIENPMKSLSGKLEPGTPMYHGIYRLPSPGPDVPRSSPRGFASSGAIDLTRDSPVEMTTRLGREPHMPYPGRTRSTKFPPPGYVIPYQGMDETREALMEDFLTSQQMSEADAEQSLSREQPIEHVTITDLQGRSMFVYPGKFPQITDGSSLMQRTGASTLPVSVGEFQYPQLASLLQTRPGMPKQAMAEYPVPPQLSQVSRQNVIQHSAAHFDDGGTIPQSTPIKPPVSGSEVFDSTSRPAEGQRSAMTPLSHRSTSRDSAPEKGHMVPGYPMMMDSQQDRRWHFLRPLEWGVPPLISARDYRREMARAERESQEERTSRSHTPGSTLQLSKSPIISSFPTLSLSLEKDKPPEQPLTAANLIDAIINHQINSSATVSCENRKEAANNGQDSASRGSPRGHVSNQWPSYGRPPTSAASTSPAWSSAKWSSPRVGTNLEDLMPMALIGEDEEDE